MTTYRCASPCHLLSPPSPILSLLPFAASSHARYFAPLLPPRGNLHPSGSNITDSRLTCTGDRRADVGRGAELSSKWRRMCALDTTGSYRRRAAFTWMWMKLRITSMSHNEADKAERGVMHIHTHTDLRCVSVAVTAGHCSEAGWGRISDLIVL